MIAHSADVPDLGHNHSSPTSTPSTTESGADEVSGVPEHEVVNILRPDVGSMWKPTFLRGRSQAKIASNSQVYHGGVGRARGVGRDRGVTLGVAVAVGVGVGVSVAVGVAVGVTDGLTVGVAVAVGVGVGVIGGVAVGVGVEHGSGAQPAILTVSTRQPSLDPVVSLAIRQRSLLSTAIKTGRLITVVMKPFELPLQA